MGARVTLVPPRQRTLGSMARRGCSVQETRTPDQHHRLRIRLPTLTSIIALLRRLRLSDRSTIHTRHRLCLHHPPSIRQWQGPQLSAPRLHTASHLQDRPTSRTQGSCLPLDACSTCLRSKRVKADRLRSSTLPNSHIAIRFSRASHQGQARESHRARPTPDPRTSSGAAIRASPSSPWGWSRWIKRGISSSSLHDVCNLIASASRRIPRTRT